MAARLAALLLVGGMAAPWSSPSAFPGASAAGPGVPSAGAGTARSAATAPTPVGAAELGSAAAWVLRVETAPGAAIRLADVVARAGAAPRAEAAPIVAGDTAPVRATADPARPDERAVATPLGWTDPSGSLTMEGAFAEAQASPLAATARAGFGAAGGTGFPLANRLFSWEQQERLLAQMSALNDAVFIPLNARIAALTPLLDVAGLVTPHFEPVSPVGLVDVGGGRLSAASAEVAGSGDFATGRAEVTVDRARLLGGFVDAAGVSAEAASERSTGGGDGRGGVWFASLSIAGVPVTADGDGIRVAANDAASRAVVQPALDLLLAALREHGVELRVGAVQQGPDGRRAAALELTITAPAARLSVSVAGAEVNLAPLASAPALPGGATPAPVPPGSAVPPPPPAVAAAAGSGSVFEQSGPAGWSVDGSPSPLSPDTPVPPSPVGGDGAPSPDGSDETASAGVAPSEPGASRPAVRRLPQAPAVARSLEAVYLILVVAAAAGAVVLPAVLPVAVRPDRRRRSR